MNSIGRFKPIRVGYLQNGVELAIVIKTHLGCRSGEVVELAVAVGIPCVSECIARIGIGGGSVEGDGLAFVCGDIRACAGNRCVSCFNRGGCSYKPAVFVGNFYLNRINARR